ncbi:MAG: thioredoxin-dependent thiol peroxidase [Terracoccus sp.]
MTDPTRRLEAGDTAPDFTLPDDTGRPVALADHRGRKVIVYFYPAAMTPGCTTQACDFRDSMASFTRDGYDVVGISKDAPAKLARFRERDGLSFPLLSDEDLAVHRAYGAFGEKKLYGKTVQGVIRSTFVIDEKGVLTRALHNVKATGHVAKLRRDLGLEG